MLQAIRFHPNVMRDMSHTIYPLARVAAGLRGESIQNSPDWRPLNWRAATPMRPGALDHEKHGCRQSDGSVKPYANTVQGCVGFLKDRTSNARD